MSEQRSGSGEKSFTTGHTIPHISLDRVDYFLPPSKSHMIRMLAIASIHDGTTNLLVRGKLGLDIESMISCLITLGVGIERVSTDDGLVITVDGVGKNGFTKPNSEVNCGNSGTALRIILGLVASLNEQVTVSGDDSLSIRDNNSMLESLSQSGVYTEKITDINLPVTIRGPWFEGQKNVQNISVDCSKSSQPLTSWMIASALFPCDVKLYPTGKMVSNQHYQLTQNLCNKFGANITNQGEYFSLPKWSPKLDTQLLIPGDASMVGFAILLTKLHNCQTQIYNWPASKDTLGNDMLQIMSPAMGIKWVGDKIVNDELFEYAIYDLTDCNDLITPLSAILALSGGGKINGISHTIYKESNRIEKTIEVLGCFGLKVKFEDNSLLIDGQQSPNAPTSPVNCYNDHRLYMTAVLLASKFGGDLIGRGLHSVADMDFLQRLGLE